MKHPIRVTFTEAEATWLADLLDLSLGNLKHDDIRRRLRSRVMLARRKYRFKQQPDPDDVRSEPLLPEASG